jgi:phosphatidylcholine synthase
MKANVRIATLAGICVHVFTALGSVCALKAALAIFDGRFEPAFVWLFVALAIDAVDGTLARAVDIETSVPRFSGERLDLVIDYVTYVFVPVLALLKGRLLTGWLGEVTAALILLSSLYHFSDLASKAEDKCFVGFPAVWNIVAFCLFAWGTPDWLAMLASLALVVLTFIPMHWLHPFRVAKHLTLNIAVTAAGLVAAAWVLATGFPGDLVARLILAGASFYYVAMALSWPWSGRVLPSGN